MNHNDRALAGLAWLAATMPTLVQQDCLKGDEITSVQATGYEVTIHLGDYVTAERIAARLGLTEQVGFDRSGVQTWWCGDIEVVGISVVTLDPAPSRRECMDKVTA